MKKKTKKRIGIAVCAVVMAVAGYNVYTIRQEYAEAGGEYDDIAGSVYLSDEAKEAVPIEEPKEKESDTQFAFEDDGPKYDIGTYPNLVIDHAALKKAQPNYKGWLYVPCLEISYPVVQGPDNDYYLHHTFEETENVAGCIFIDHECNADLSSYNTFIYGHNMKNGSMFQNLYKFTQEEFFDREHNYVYVYTPDGTLIYEVYACYYSDDRNILENLDFSKPEDLEKYVEGSRQPRDMGALTKEDVPVTVNDNILTLSTCVYGYPGSRLLVQAVLLYEDK